MGRTKNYLRYVHDATFGVVAASQVGASVEFLHMRGTKDRFLASPANENVYIWDTKTKQVVNTLRYDAENAAEVTMFDCYHGGHPRTNLIAIGYSNGHVRLFEYETGLLKSTFTGHRTAISALSFDKDGSRLASGGKDCNIVIWDVIGEKGLFSLRGHKNSITKLAFLRNEEHQKDLIVSSSVDAVATIKFWDLQLQHCFCTVPGQASGVWSFVILGDGTRLVAGSTSPELKVYSIEFFAGTKIEDNSKDEETLDNMETEDLRSNSESEYGLKVKLLGSILRNTAAISNRVQDLIVDHDETIMVCHSVDKNIELYGLRSDEEALSYAKKSLKKESRKLAKRKARSDDSTELEEEDVSRPTVTSLDCLAPQKLVDSLFNRKLGSQKLSDKVKALAIAKSLKKQGLSSYKIGAMLSSNKIEVYSYEPNDTDKEMSAEIRISNSHRTDVRAVSISSDNTLILSASGESAKIWLLDSCSCTTTIETEYATCCTFANAEHLLTRHANRHALIGSKNGNIQILDIYSAQIIETIQVCNDGKPLNSICVLPDKSGIVCGGEDGIVRFFNYVWKTEEEDGTKETNLSLEESRSLPFQEGITCVSVSKNNNLLAVALLDSTVRVHFMDTFKYFLTMYGHKFPVTTMDISDDNTLIVTGSPDKNIKIWGLDFGDCHKSIFAHNEAITCVRFVPKTHHVFSSGRDRHIKQWDCDHFIKIQTLRKHMGEIWCMSVSSNGKYLVTGSHDKSLRLYRKTEEILIPEEEEDAEREIEDERNVYEQQENIVLGETNTETGFAAKMTIESVKSTDRLIEAIEVYGVEQEKERDYIKACELASSRGEPKPVEPEHDPLLMTVSTTDYNRYILEVLRRIRSSELEEILLTLPFDYVKKLLIILVILLERSWDVELMVRCAAFLLKVNFGQIAASPTLVPVVTKLEATILERSTYLRDCAGFNLMSLEHFNQNRKYQSTKVSRANWDISVHL